MLKIFAACLSPIDSKKRLDVQKLTQFCNFLLTEGNCDGIAPLGTTGEATSISLKDRLNVPKELYHSSINPDNVILGVGSSSFEDTLLMIKQSQNYGFDRVLVIPPFYYKNISPDGLFTYYANLVGAIGNHKIRIILYHFPQLSCVPFPCEIVAKLFQEFSPIICGVKDSSGDFNQTLSFIEATGGIEKGFCVYPSSEKFLLKAQQSGCAGVISGSLNAFGSYSSEALNNIEKREHFMDLVVKARKLSEKYPLIPAMKFIQSLQSGDQDWDRLLPPLTNLKPNEKTALQSELVELGFLTH